MTEALDVWLMLAFPGTNTGRYSLRAFAPAKSGKCWFRSLSTREQALRCRDELKADGIRFVCKKVARSANRRGYSKPSTAQTYQTREAHKNRQSPGQQAENNRAFETWKQAMRVDPVASQKLPEPKNGPEFGRSPGLSKSGPSPTTTRVNGWASPT